MSCEQARAAHAVLPVCPRVMSFIEKSVARLDQQDRLDHLAVELGRSHYCYNAPPRYYSVRLPGSLPVGETASRSPLYP